MHDPEVMVFDLRWIEVWHREPGGKDSGAVCPRNRWAWHVHHWRLNSIPLKMLRRRLLTRCAWCGGKSRKGDSVNHARGWRDRRGPWWRGEDDLYHGDCLTMETAARSCMCDEPDLGDRGYGECRSCGRFRTWANKPTDLDRAMAALPRGSRRPQWITEELRRRHAERTSR
ncbi:hypothetical protein [Nocardia sp. NPDC019302]|uniref:hypothetical protein n=1 Tax=Nocardia sp. NPDC019302 TaxID=3154592 RepID=UPI0033D8D0A6